MPDAREAEDIIRAAEGAANGGDYAAAEGLLREAAGLQETRLGPLHPDLANTLNNLGVVCEITKKPDEAEASFRRAHAIAVASLPPDHPFVATSRKNLEDFCAANGRAIGALPTPAAAETPVIAPPTPTPKPEPPALTPAPPAPTPEPTLRAPAPKPTRHAPPPQPTSLRWLVTVGVLIALALVIAWVLFGRNTAPPASPPAAGDNPPSAPGPREATPSQPARDSARTAPASPPPKQPPASTRPSAAGKLTVSAQLCRDLRTGGPGEWQCVPVDKPASPGRLVFYTRVKSATDATLQHRWYRGDRLVESVDLNVRANPGSGYRTYSRHTVGSGEWRIELRAPNGELLHEERFSVR
jgi:hypothetical protein